MTDEWLDLLSEREAELLDRGRFSGRVGFGERPALLIIDAQNYMVGPLDSFSEDYPSGCGMAAQRALEALVPLLRCARNAGVPVIYTKLEYRRDGGDIGIYGRKRSLFAVDGWCMEGATGAEIVDLVAPTDEDLVLPKKKFSAFFGTPLLSYLIDRGIDTLVVVGGSTSNCVRATVLDSASYNLHTIVVRDCVFDRFDISHRVALFDMDRMYADVVDSAQVIAELRARQDIQAAGTLTT